MRETIILAPGASNSELLRSLARFGKNTLGLRVLSRVELAKYALMRSGISIKEEFLAAKEEPSVIYSFLNEVGYFKAASFADAENLSSAIMTMRSLIPSDEECAVQNLITTGEFTEKNRAVAEVYERFIDKCRKEGRIDSISLVRKAINSAEEIQDVEFLFLSEFPLQPIDVELLKRISDGRYRETSLTELCKRDSRTGSSVPDFTQGYGQINEAESILDGIYRNEIPLDKCVIAASNTAAYSQIFFDLSCSYGIPVTYGCGVPILNSNPARLLKLIYEWKTSGYYGIDALRRIISSDAFDRKKFAKAVGEGEDDLKRKDMEEFVKMAGSIRLSFDDIENRKRLCELKKLLDSEAEYARSGNDANAVSSAEYMLRIYSWVERFADELIPGCVGLLSSFSLIRSDESGTSASMAVSPDQSAISARIDQSAINVITELLNSYERFAPDGDINEIIPEILRKTVCSENSREGCLHVTSITGALSCMRENLYVCGLDSTEFPGSPLENYLLLDSDLLLLAEQDKAPTSDNRIRRKTGEFYDLLRYASSLGVTTHLSYPDYSLSELKDRNPSSVLFAVYEELYPGKDMDDFREAVTQAPFFSSGLSADRLIGDEYSRGAEFSSENRSVERGDTLSALDRVWSPSALSNYLQCPRHFYLANILRIPEEEEDDPFQVLNAAEIGTLAHLMMEKLAADDYTRDRFIADCSDAFDKALLKRPPVHPSDAADLKKEFIKMMETSYDKDPHNRVISSEKEYCFDHPSGIRIHGYLDRVEQDCDGRYIVADFKTKRKVDHVQDDFDTCMQVVVYAWLCEQAGIDISSCEYRYLRKGRTVTCRYDDEMRAHLNDFLTDLRESIENNYFPRIESTVNCKYCKLSGICRHPEDGETEEVGDDE